jgi:hypothetical protein
MGTAAPGDAMIGPALDALDAWVDYRESGGTSGALPPDPIVTPMGQLSAQLTERRRTGDAREARRMDLPGQRPARRPEHRAGRRRAGDNPAPEALAVRNAYDAAGGAAGVDVVMDLHHQGSRTDAAGRMVTGSTLWPNATATADALGIRGRRGPGACRRQPPQADGA